MKKYDPKFGLFKYEAIDGYLRLAIGKFNKNQLPIMVFTHMIEATNTLHEMVRSFDLCPELCRLGNCSSGTGNCSTQGGICPRKTSPDYYNDLVNEALETHRKQLPTFAILDQGRHPGEQSCIYVEKGRFCAMGYLDQTSELTQLEGLKDELPNVQGNHYMMQLIYSYAKAFPQKVLMEAYEMWEQL